MANLIEIIIQAKNEASKEIEGVAKTLDKLAPKLRAAGIAMTAVGVAGLKMVDDARNLNAELAQTGITVGLTTDQMRAMAMDLTDVSSPLKEVTATLEVLARAGIRGEDQLKATASAFDALADATGGAADEVAATLIPAFKTLGIEIPSSSKDLDRFTWLVKNTSVDLEDFASAMNYVAREGGDLGVTLDDMISIMAILESRGITGKAATMLFRRAVTEASSEGKALGEVLGITSEELANYNTKIGTDAVGATTKYADAANTQYGLMDKIKQKFQELTFMAGSFLEPLEPLLGVMTALGPVMLFFSTASGKAVITTTALVIQTIAHTAAMLASKVVMIAAAAAQWALNVAMSANPIGLIILAVAGLVLGIIALIKNFDKVKAAFQAVGDFIMGVFQAIGGFFVRLVEGIKSVFWKIVDIVLTPIRLIVNGVIAGINWAIRAVNKLPGINIGEIDWRFPTFATEMGEGGIAMGPTAAIIGERGPEAVIPLTGNNAMGTTVIVNVYGSVKTERELADIIYDQLVTRKRYNAVLELG